MTRDEIAGASRAEGGMFAVIPAVVMKDQELSMSARMLYGIITWRCNSDSKCWPTNRALGEDLGLSAKRVSSLLALLEAQGHIEMETVCDPETGQIVRRYIYPIVKSGRGIPKNEDTPPQGQGEGIPENAEEKYKEENINLDHPLPPQGDSAPDVQQPKPKRKRAPKSAPSWIPERFEGFWAAYPRDEDRAKAVEQWDKLPHDRELMERYGSEDALLHDIALGLKIHLECEDWREGRGIPYAFRWLRDRRWLEKRKTVRPAPEARPARVVDSGEVPVW